MAQNRRAQTALKIGDLAPKRAPKRRASTVGPDPGGSGRIRRDPSGPGGNLGPSRPAGEIRARVSEGPCLNLKTKDFERLYGKTGGN